LLKQEQKCIEESFKQMNLNEYVSLIDADVCTQNSKMDYGKIILSPSESDNYTFDFNDIDIKHELPSKSSFSELSLVEHKPSKKLMILKKFNTILLETNKRANVVKKIYKSMNCIKTENIVKLLGFHCDPGFVSHFFKLFTFDFINY
jgi:hypothetical protein